MRYIEKNENVTREYEVIINVEKLNEIVNELNEKCSHVIKKTAKITSGSQEEALNKISSYCKKAINILSVLDANALSDDYSFLRKFSKPQYVFEYEFDYTQTPYLSYLLTLLINNYRMDIDFTEYLKQLVDYENGAELNAYKEKMAEEGITEKLYSEYELLYGLYQAAKDCFRIRLLSETITYDEDKALEKRLGK